MTLNGTETRWHMSSTQVPDVFPSTPAANWDYPNTGTGQTYVSSFVRRSLVLANQETTPSPMTNFAQSANTTTSGLSVLLIQLVSGPLPGPVALSQRIISGAVSSYTNNVATATFFFAAYFWRPSTGVKVAGASTFSQPQQVSGDGTGITNATITARVLFSDVGTKNGTVVLQAGDRFVLELGFVPTSTGTGAVGIRLGNPGTTLDTPSSNGNTYDGTPWVAVSQDLYSGRSLLPNAGKTRPRMFAPGVTR